MLDKCSNIFCSVVDCSPITPFPLDWQPVEIGVLIHWDLDNIPILIQSDSVAGSGDLIVIWTQHSIALADGSTGGSIKVKYGSTFQFKIHVCTGFMDFPVQPPSETTNSTRVWRITKTSSALKMSCDDLQVLDYAFGESSLGDSMCSGLWQGDTVKSLKFSKSLVWPDNGI